MIDKRKLPRKRTTVYFGIYERDTDRFFGCLVDITKEGVMVISETPIEVDTNFHFRMDIPDEIKGASKVEFDAKCAWCELGEKSNFYDAGFEIIDITADNLEILEFLLEDSIFRFAEEQTSITVYKTTS